MSVVLRFIIRIDVCCITRDIQLNAVAQKKKLETQLAELEQQLDVHLRVKEDLNRQLKKTQQFLKEIQQEAEEARLAKDDASGQLRDAERKYAALNRSK